MQKLKVHQATTARAGFSTEGQEDFRKRGASAEPKRRGNHPQGLAAPLASPDARVKPGEGALIIIKK